MIDFKEFLANGVSETRNELYTYLREEETDLENLKQIERVYTKDGVDFKDCQIGTVPYSNLTYLSFNGTRVYIHRNDTANDIEERIQKQILGTEERIEDLKRQLDMVKDVFLDCAKTIYFATEILNRKCGDAKELKYLCKEYIKEQLF